MSLHASDAPLSAGSEAAHDAIPFRGVHHVGLLVEDLNRSLDFYCGTLGACTTLKHASFAAKSLVRAAWVPRPAHRARDHSPDLRCCLSAWNAL